MSTYLPNYQHDIFVSYIQPDNKALTGTTLGWVATLVEGLKSRLTIKLGTYSLFWEAVPENSTVQTARLELLTHSATLLVILSPHYLTSPSCRSELTTFLALIGQASRRVLVVEPEKLERSHEFRELLIYPFWVADASGQSRTLAMLPEELKDQTYNQKLDDLTLHIAETLKLLSATPLSSHTPSGGIHIGDVGENVTLQAGGDIVAGDKTVNQVIETQYVIQQTGPRATVFLAEVTDDLLEQRNEIRRYLEQRNIAIVPNTMYFFGEANAAELLRQAIEADLQKTTLFIQLLSQVNPQRPPGMSTPQLQHAYAQNIKDLLLLQWRNAQLDLTTITDPVQQAFLDATTVMATSLENFKYYIVHKLEQIEAEKRREAEKRHKQTVALSSQAAATSNDLSESQFVFIDIPAQHENFGETISELLEEEGIGSSLPLLEEVSPTEKRQDLEDNLKDCDAVILLYDDNLVRWIREQLRHCRRLQAQREKPLKTIAVFNQIAPKKPSLGMKLPNMRILDCAILKDNACLPQFIQTLRK
jgi:hypothetical protein